MVGASDLLARDQTLHNFSCAYKLLIEKSKCPKLLSLPQLS